MKKIFLMTSILLSSLLTFAQPQKAEFQASGLTCSMCSNAINKALKTVPFIASVNTDLNKNVFELIFKKDAAVDLDVIRKKVEDAGFSIAKLWITIDLGDVKIGSEEHVTAGGLNFHFMNVKQQTSHGSQRLQVVDKNFVSQKEYKRFSSYTTMPCYQTGIMAACCKTPGNASVPSGRMYHVTI